MEAVRLRNDRKRCHRIELQPTESEQRLLSEAAAREGVEVESSILAAALRAAQTGIGGRRPIVLSQRDTARMPDLLESPPSSTPALHCGRATAPARMSAPDKRPG
jgi:uncharacterized protein (DUF1778 family)